MGGKKGPGKRAIQSESGWGFPPCNVTDSEPPLGGADGEKGAVCFLLHKMCERERASKQASKHPPLPQHLDTCAHTHTHTYTYHTISLSFSLSLCVDHPISAVENLDVVPRQERSSAIIQWPVHSMS